MRVIRNPRLPGGWAIEADYYSPVLSAICRGVPGMQSLGRGTFSGHLDAVRLAVAGLEIRGLRFDATALEGADEPGKFLAPIAAKGLRPYQVEAVRYLLSRKCALLADAMGLGKSCSALTAARALASKTLVVCPSYVRGVWAAPQGEIMKWWPAARDYVACPAGTKPRPLPAETKVVVIHYDIFAAWADALKEWGPRVLIIDEGQALMNEGSKRSTAIKAVRAGCEFVWVLTGTPPLDRPKDAWNMVDTISPGRFGGFFGYGLRYCDAAKKQVTPTKAVWDFSGASNLPELRERFASFMLRRTAADVALQLPPKTRQIVMVEVPARAHLMPDAGAKAMRESLNKSADAKIADAAAMLLAHVSEGHKCVVFCYRRSVAEFIANTISEAGFTSGIIHGGVPALRRGLAIEKAKATLGGHALCCTIDATATGIDFSYADVGVFVELTYEPNELLQAEARLHRFGQQRPVLIQYIIARGTTDELIASKVVGKLDTWEAVVGTTGESLGGDLKGKPEEILADLYACIEKGKKR